MENKCYICATKVEHTFGECLSATCSCLCVNELRTMGTNRKWHEAKPIHPKFLHIENGKIKDLPGVAVEISKFVRIRKSEWLPKKQDRRFKKK